MPAHRSRLRLAAIGALVVVGSIGAGLAQAVPAAPAPAPGGPRPAVEDNWTTYHYDQLRHGYDPNAATASGQLSVAWQAALDGAVYAEPLVVNGRVIAVTENDTAYGLNLDGSVAWTQHLGTPVPLSELPCGNIDPLGITGTPIYDAGTGRIYFVAEFDDPIRHELFALDAETGAIAWSRNVDPTGSTPMVQQQRGAMAISHGRVWVSYGALAGDCGDYHGYEIGAKLDGGGALQVYRTPSERGAGLWAPTGPAVDEQGHLYVAPANGAAFEPPYDDSDSILKLDGVRKVSIWAPDNWAEENEADKGQGPSAPLLFSALGHRWAFTVGKAGTVYLLHARNLGGIGGEVATATGCKVWGGQAFDAGVIYVPCLSGMAAYTIRQGPRIKRLWHTRATGYGSAPVLGGGALWAAYEGSLLQLDPTDGHTVATIGVGTLPHFSTPTLHDSLVLVGTLAGITAVSTQ